MSPSATGPVAPSRVQLGMPTLPSQIPSRSSVAGGPDTTGPDPSRGLMDSFGRRATDLRISLIDKCNLRCTYCMPAEGLPWLSKDQLLSAAEIRRLVDIGVNTLGVRELRLTGGEPLVRADLVEIIAALRADHPDLPIAMTTNAIGLERKAAALAEAGLTRVNISLDSVHRETFAQLTRRDSLDKVLIGVEAAAAAGLTPLKINAVLMRGINDAHAADLLEWSVTRGFELRFIEQMPLDGDQQWNKEGTISAAETRELLSERFVLTPTPENRDGAPAERFDVYPLGTSAEEIRHGRQGPPLGRVGVIASVTEPFCADCRRTRLTAEGRVMSCLFSNEEFDLMHLLRNPATTDAQIAQAWAEAMWLKPAAHGTDRPGFDLASFHRPDRSMSAIGG
ncbi:cyclic pyranopterin monophosphate synthase subunit MoaA [Nesterenkonia sandarakina]|uniref:GTP 3',8-cyclase n=2 Tax=Nesterenkonia sandarakina TaxID=272918 RepID=A0A2T0YK46_9MICC|nr:cyclic pyranopterin monophosphate synthase subunit MoaA [Nesterenkonia sandarakina]